MGTRLTVPTGLRYAPVAPPLLLLNESFESPGVTGFNINTLPDSGKILGATNGFGATRRGLDESSSGNWVAPGAGDQAYTFQYTNSGIATADGEIEGLDIQNITYRARFNVPFATEFPNSFELVTASGSVADDNTRHIIELVYTTDPFTDLAKSGFDLFLRIAGATSKASITDIQVWKEFV